METQSKDLAKFALQPYLMPWLRTSAADTETDYDALTAKAAGSGAAVCLAGLLE
jgi:hypothetical protein